MVFQDPLFMAIVNSERGSAINKDLHIFSKINLLGKNGVCLKDHARNLIKFILKPKLSQFDALSVQKCVHRQVQ